MDDAAQDRVFGELSKNWGWMFALGILMLVLGTIGLGMSVTLSIVSMLYFGILMLFGSGVQLVQAFRSEAWRGRFGHVLIAVLYLFAGATMLADPELASVTLTLFIAWALVVIGGLRVSIAIQMRGTQGWMWTLIGGIVTIVLGLMIINEWPASGLWVIGLFIAIEMIFAGWSHIMIALAAKNHHS
jgi:uncharacterized membrane protein HdeD (DUF308 family)